MEQIEENLPGAERVEQERREIGGAGQFEGQPIFGGLGAQHIQHVGAQLCWVDLLEVE